MGGSQGGVRWLERIGLYFLHTTHLTGDTAEPVAVRPTLYISGVNVKKIHTLVFICLLMAGCGDEQSATAVSKSGARQPGQDWLATVSQDPAYQKACEEVPGCVESRQPWTEPVEAVWRLLLIRESDGQISIARIELIEVVEGDGVPVGPLGGDALLVGLDKDGKALDGQLIRFPATLFLEAEARDQEPQSIDLAGQRVASSAYIRALPDITSFAVKNQAGDTLATAEAPPSRSVTGLDQLRHWMPEIISSAVARSSPGPGLPPHCAHVRVLDGEIDRDSDDSPFLMAPDLVTLETPGPYQLAALLRALNMMEPLLCQAVHDIAFVSFPLMEQYMAGAVLQIGLQGDFMMINVESNFDESTLASHEFYRVNLTNTIIHESGHAAEALLNSQGSSPGAYGGSWPGSSRTLARQTIDNVRMRKGFGSEWRRVQDSFKSFDWASSYSPQGYVTDATNEMTPEQVANGGFMSRYGATSWWDDIAEFVALTYMSSEWARIGRVGAQRFDLGCQKMQAYGGENVPAKLAAVYTKLLFLRDLGLVKAQDVADCMGPKLGLQTTQKGVHMWVDGNYRRSFANNLSANISEETLGNHVFTLYAFGEAIFGTNTFPAKIELRLDLGGTLDSLEDVAWPRGVYELGMLSDNNLYLRLDGAKAGNFDVDDGYVLISEASNDRIAGSAVIQYVWRLQAPVPVPQRYDPPLVMRFMIEH